ncbi:Kiwa anti-phage protein KwaB-like domain-containing protein [Clostridium sp. KNHs214]|uniref:Kiwa anti-phage protein KwaB-like domain-containing protein n=1 Tax=Clostridium sp. KNHs214 TaxID=1540257 RepID=UPI000689851E|nr:Kiwa anti-phage protein KwaB-like domain-containing protein [Clostridium sp. KNHs214]
MFEDCSVMIIAAGAHANEIYRLDVDADTQKDICSAFETALGDLITDKTRIKFDGSYKPHRDEFLAVENFQLADKIKDAIRDPLGVTVYEKKDGNFLEIKAVFLGKRTEADDTEKFKVAFQRFRKEQYISTSWFNLFFTDDTFHREKNFGISISDNIDCFYTEGELQFSSFFFARQVFDLGDYYRSATDQEVECFAGSDKLSLENVDNFKGMANTWNRRKIAMINDSKVLENYSANEIKDLAYESGIIVNIKDEKVVIPNDKEQVKIILGFLDEEAYKGPFSRNTYLANSKRKVSN